MAAGVNPDVARTRINRYEKGVNECDLRTAKKLADALGLPLAALFAESDGMAEAIVVLSKLSEEQLSEALIKLTEQKRTQV